MRERNQMGNYWCGITRQILGYDGHIMMVKIKAEKAGPVGVEHAHYHPQVTYVSSGKFEFTIGNEKKVVTAGDGMYMEPDVRHSCICIEPGVIVDCFSPMREDFLKKVIHAILLIFLRKDSPEIFFRCILYFFEMSRYSHINRMLSEAYILQPAFRKEAVNMPACHILRNGTQSLKLSACYGALFLEMLR